MTTAPAIAFDYRPSRLLFAATLVVVLLALVAVWGSGGHGWLRVAASLCVVVGGAAGLGGALRPRVRSVAWRRDGGAELVLHERRADRGEVQGGVQAARVLGPLIVLTVRWPPRERAHLWILPDNLDADTRRRLRVRLAAHAGGLPSGNADTH